MLTDKFLISFPCELSDQQRHSTIRTENTVQRVGADLHLLLGGEED